MCVEVIGWEAKQNDLFCIKWDINQSINQSACKSSMEFIKNVSLYDKLQC